MITPQGALDALFDQPLAGAGNRIGTGVQSAGDLAIAPSFASVRGVGFQQDAGFQHLTRGVLTLIDH